MKKSIDEAYLICCQTKVHGIVPTNKFCLTEKEAEEYVRIRNKQETKNYVYKPIVRV